MFSNGTFIFVTCTKNAASFPITKKWSFLKEKKTLIVLICKLPFNIDHNRLQKANMLFTRCLVKLFLLKQLKGDELGDK